MLHMLDQDSETWHLFNQSSVIKVSHPGTSKVTIFFVVLFLSMGLNIFQGSRSLQHTYTQIK